VSQDDRTEVSVIRILAALARLASRQAANEVHQTRVGANEFLKKCGGNEKEK